MKKTLISLSLASLLIISASSCRRDVYGCTDPTASNFNRSANINDGSCTYYTTHHYGNVIFWFNANNGTGTVNIGGQTANITTYQTGGIPSCGNTGSATFTLEAGTYPYTASATNGFTWADNATVIEGQCQAYELR